MKLFLSWSGELSRNVALIFREWLPSVIQSIEPYVSSEDIDKGTRWSSDIAGELNNSNYGIIVVTKDNIKAPWINFEAGALSKHIDKSHVSPFLFNLKKSEVAGPLLQFQSTIYSKEDMWKLIQSINKALRDEALDQERLSKVFNVWWPNLEDELNSLSTSGEDTDDSNGNGDVQNGEILEELLELARNQLKILNSPTDLLPPLYLRDVMNVRNNNISKNSITDLFDNWERIDFLIRELKAEPSNNVELIISEIEDHLGVIRKIAKYLDAKTGNHYRRMSEPYRRKISNDLVEMDLFTED